MGRHLFTLSDEDSEEDVTEGSTIRLSDPWIAPIKMIRSLDGLVGLIGD